jgi:hypothetical protein
MACIRRQVIGSCTHHQCEFPNESGFECIDLIEEDGIAPGDDRGYELVGKCEVGFNCVKACQFSYGKAGA